MAITKERKPPLGSVTEENDVLSEAKYPKTVEEKQKPGTPKKGAVLMRDDGGSSLEKLVVRKSRAVAGPVRCSTLELDSQESHKTSE